MFKKEKNMKSLTLFFSELTIVKKILLVLTPILTVMLNSQSAMVGLALLIFLDLLSGIRKDFYIKQIKAYIWQKAFWREVKSYGIRETWKKTYEYGIGIIVCSIFESMIFKMDPIQVMNKGFSLTELSIMIASAVEVYSNYENMEAVSGRNVFKKIINLLPKTVQDLFTKNKQDAKV